MEARFGKHELDVKAPRQLLALTAIALIAALTSGCGAGNNPASTAVVRDSAGTTIVENVSPLWSDAEALQIAAEPSLIIGEAGEDDPTQQLFRVQSAHRTTQGNVVVANAGSSEVRIYGADGALRHAGGRSGGGPGEFGALTWLAVDPADSVFTHDSREGRVSVFNSSATFVRSFSPQSAGQLEQPFRSPVGLLDDGTAIAMLRISGMGALPAAGGTVRDTAIVVRMDRDGTFGDALARVPAEERILRGSPSEGVIEFLVSPFARRLVVAARGDRFCAIEGDGYDIACYRADGSARRLVRLAGVERPVSSDDVETAVEQRTANVSDEAMRRRLAAEVRNMMPDRFPAVSRLVIDAAGQLWAMDFVAPADTVATWRVFDGNGIYLGVVAMPRELTVHEIGGDYVLGVERDEYGVEQVRMYGLTGGR